MLWLALTLTAAVCESGRDILSKRGLRDNDPYLVAWLLNVFALPLLLALLAHDGLPGLNAKFWWALAGKNLARDHHLLHFAGAFVDAQGTHFAVERFHRTTAHEAGGAVQLQSLIDDLLGGLGGE